MDCSVEAWFNIPAENVLVNGRVAPDAVLGNNVLVVPLDNVGPYRQQIVYTLLGCPLQKDKVYNLVFFLYTGKGRFNKLDIGFSTQEPKLDSTGIWPTSTKLTITDDQVIAGFRGGWKVVDVLVYARGGEQFMLLGNLDGQHATYKAVEGMNKKGDILCFIDEIILKPVQFSDSCTTYAANKKLAYQQNDRHTEHERVIKEIKPSPSAIRWISDTLVMPSVYFDINQSKIRKKGRACLDSLVSALSSKQIGLLRVIGHTDQTGNDVLNDTLSRNRAVTVAQYLSERLSLTHSQVQAEGKGASTPVADNRTAAGRERNRRVELIVSYLAPKN